MTRIVGYICLGILGGIAVLAGIFFCLDGFFGMEDVVAVTGKIKVVKPAEDELLGLTDMGPVIFREAEMYQYQKKDIRVSKGGSTYYYQYAELNFLNGPQPEFEAYESKAAARSLFGSMKKFQNPPFPKEFLNENGTGKTPVYGTVEIGDDGIRLGGSLLRYFDGQENTLKDEPVPAYHTPEEAGEKLGLRLVEDGVYASGNPEEPELGDLRVTYRVVAPEVLEGEFTAIGKLTDDNVLEEYSDYGALYHGVVTLEEANHDFRVEQFKTGFCFLLFGIVVLVGGFFMINVLYG